MTSAVVFAYHDVGVRCLSAVLDGGVDVPLVITHTDNPAETIWFESVAALAHARGIECIAPSNPNAPEIVERVSALKPDFLFSFYYRHMLGAALLSIPKRGALNMHGSLLPKYRGRAPVNWAILNGETQTGATLHYMREKPDAGPIVDRQPVDILPDETAVEVFRKVTGAAQTALQRSLPKLIAGTATAREQNLAEGSYFGGRRPADGIIDWTQTAKQVHDLVRAVAPPYPGAWTTLDGKVLKIVRTALDSKSAEGRPPGTLYSEDGKPFVAAGDGKRVQLLEMEESSGIMA